MSAFDDEAMDLGAVDAIADLIGRLATDLGVTVGVAESLTGGLVVQGLAKAKDSSQWLCGGVVAYASRVKHDLLDVAIGSVVSREAAASMAGAVRRVLGADVAIAVTGVGGPDHQDGQPPGTVWIAVHDGTQQQTFLHHFDGGPAEVCHQARTASLEALASRLEAKGKPIERVGG